MARLAATVALIALVTACGGGQGQDGVVSSLSYPASPTRERFDVVERCSRGDLSCEEEASAAIAVLLSNLGNTYRGDGLTSTELSEALPNRLVVRAESSSGLEFLTDTRQGTATSAIVDLTGLINGRTTYVVLNSAQGVLRFEVPPEPAERLMDALFVRASGAAG
jgi:hypothetical protein